MEETKRKKKVALYIRVSTEEQKEMYGIDLQRSALMGLIASKAGDLELAGKEYIYVDEGVSGTIAPEERPAFRRLMEDISMSADRPFDCVAVYKIDRFARRLKILLDVLDIFGKGESRIEFLSANESIDTSTPFGRAMLGIIGVIAELELETIRERTTAGKEASASKGVFQNVPPLGYVKGDDGKILIQNEEREVVEMIFHMFVREHKSTHEIANYLMEYKIHSPQSFRYKNKKEDRRSRKLSKGGPYCWDTGAVRRILKDELYIGNQYYSKSKSGKKLPKESWKVFYHSQDFIDKKLFAQAQVYLASSSRKHKVSQLDSRKYLLQGLLKCANCYDPVLHKEPYAWHGTSKTVRSTGNKAYYYLCSTKNLHKSKRRNLQCLTIPIPAVPLEKHVMKLVRDLLDNPKVVFKYQQELQSKKVAIKHKNFELEKVKRSLNSYENAKKSILIMFKDGDITREKKIAELKELQEKYVENTQKKKNLESELSVFTDTKEYFKVFEIFKEKYKEVMKDYDNAENLESMYGLIHMMIEEIIVFSRPRRKTDVVSGPKKEGQMIPYKLKLSLKIPSEMLGELLYSLSSEAKLQAKEEGWWATQESNL